jgi:hypothetical protein
LPEKRAVAFLLAGTGWLGRAAGPALTIGDESFFRRPHAGRGHRRSRPAHPVQRDVLGDLESSTAHFEGTGFVWGDLKVNDGW